MKKLIKQNYKSYLERVIIIVNKYFLAKGYRGVSLWPFVIVRDKTCLKDTVFLNHEKIHLRQQLELLILPFYFLYGLEFLFRLYQFKNPYMAYRKISFECEAYANEKDFNYLEKRKIWNFRRYLKQGS